MSAAVTICCDVTNCERHFVGDKGDNVARVRKLAHGVGWRKGRLRSLQDCCPKHAEYANEPLR